MLDKDLRKQLEGVFYNYDRIRRLAAEGADVALYGTPLRRNGKRTSHGNPTEARAFKLYSANEGLKWCKVVELTLKYFDKTGKDELIRLKYFQGMGEVKLCHRLHIERCAIYDWVNDVLQYSAMIALQMGLAKVIKE